MTDWLQFDGGILPKADHLLLIARNGNGSIEIAAGDIRLVDGKVQVRSGAKALGISEPGAVDDRQRPTLPDVAHRCASGITLCIGGVLICAGDFKVIGPCVGAWGASRAFVPP